MDEQRQLAAIMFTDIVGYTALMSGNESRALAALKRNRKLVQAFVKRFRGRWLESVGDGNLVSFSSATDAVNCALAVQRALDRDAELQLRIGIHVGDIIWAGNHIYGDGVNVASRIHALAEPGGIVVSEPVYDAVRNKSGISVDRLGVREIKGLDHPIQVYSLSGEAVDVPLLGFIDLPEARRWTLVLSLAALAVVLVLTVGIYTRFQSVRASDTSIVVLPFKNLSDDPSNSYFSEGISEELIIKLSRVTGLRVAGRSSSFAHGSEAQDVREIGKNLNVSHLLEGTVRRAGDHVRISAQLSDTDSGFQLWAETYDARIDDIFKVQEDISRSIVEALRLELMPRELAQVGTVGTSDVEAYDLYLKARADIRAANSADDYDEALATLESALRRDPTFAEAEAARCEALVGKYNQTRDAEVLSPAVDICNRALTMDPRAAHAHVALGDLYLTTGRYDFAVESFGRALPLDPNNADVYVGLAGALIHQGRVEDAETYFDLAVELSPRDATLFRTYGAYMALAGRFEKAEQLLRRAIELDPQYSRAHSDLGGILFYQGRLEEASESMIRATETDPYDRAYNNIGTVLFMTGEFERSVEIFRKAAELAPHDPRVIGGLADACRMAPGCERWKEHYRNALALTDERLAVNPDDAQVIALKGVYLNFLGDPEEGRRLVERAVQLDPENVNVVVNAAIFWSQYGDRNKVAEYVEKAQALGYPEEQLESHPDIVLARNQSGQ